MPCSRSRISAAPVRMMESMVTMLISSINDPNHAGLSAGLKRERTVSSMGCSATVRSRCTNSATSSCTICCTAPLAANACPMRVASMLSCTCGTRPASTSRWKWAGICSTSVKRPASSNGSTSRMLIMTGRVNWGA
ncbi:hypothetical protein D3C72_1821080 [compost metagenome]